MTVYLIRHGMTVANEQHLYCGSTDVPLSTRGRAELAKKHYTIENVRFVTSGMRRTDETLRILFPHAVATADPRFREMDFGIFEMHSYEQLKADPQYLAWITGDNEANLAPQGESGVQLRCRVLEAFRDLHEDTCVITHGGCIALLMAQLFPQERKNRYEWQPKPGEGYAVDAGGYRPICGTYFPERMSEP